eukprot:CAMPEP_0167800430 /NCGR_PEP_ID=MMETSP0111_2-20121227/17719_1 /TAXON_ID=91324 /ORGANISM="Lotharella globosa, Strain CCCM811" /LENGTH=69 /DNA_ID=CAMNT_0007695673 /DNA_START=234 /DNA_END=443 /DNA_ORIENTATION=-
MSSEYSAVHPRANDRRMRAFDSLLTDLVEQNLPLDFDGGIAGVDEFVEAKNPRYLAGHLVLGGMWRGKK